MNKKRVFTLIGLALVLVLAGVVWYRYYFVFGTGSKAGTMNYFVHKGYLFKTYEGRLIQAGFRAPGQGAVQSNEFVFSVTDKKVAKALGENAGAYLQLHYKEYFHTLPWRGVSVFVVDSIISIQQVQPIQP